MPGFVPEIELGVDGIRAESGEQGLAKCGSLVIAFSRVWGTPFSSLHSMLLEGRDRLFMYPRYPIQCLAHSRSTARIGD